MELTRRPKSVRFLALFLALMMLALASCSETNKEEKKPDVSQNAAQNAGANSQSEDVDPDALFTKIYDDLPAGFDLDARRVTFLQRSTDRTKDELFVDEMTGDVVVDAIFQRELAVEDRLNVKLEAVKDSTDNHGNDLLSKVANSVTSADGAYDVLANSNWTTANTMTTGYYLNLYNVENLNLSKEYWAQYLIENSAVGGSLFGITGSISLYMYQELFAVYFNRDLCLQYGLPASDVYSTVFEGVWTLDKMISMTKDFYSDANGNGEKDAEDVYGYGLQVSSSTDGYWSSCQIRMVARDEDGYLKRDVDLEKLSNVVEKLQDFAYKQPGVFRTVEGTGFTDGEYVPNGFATDHFLFTNDWIYEAGTANLREMESDYGIIPYPKYDEAQEQYYSFLHDQFTTFCIISTVEKPGEIGAVLEAMASESHNSVIPAYYDVALTNKYARDLDSVRSLEIIFSNPYLDSGWVYSLNMSSFPQQILREPIWRGKLNPATLIARLGPKIDKTLEKLNDSFEEAAGK